MTNQQATFSFFFLFCCCYILQRSGFGLRVDYSILEYLSMRKDTRRRRGKCTNRVGRYDIAYIMGNESVTLITQYTHRVEDMI